LLLTVLCHEMGHGTMARRLGGQISQVLLWPFGGICFTTRPTGRNAREKLVDDLKIVAAGPATHFPQAAVWLVAFISLVSTWELANLDPAWHMLIPFSNPRMPCFTMQTAIKGCLQSYGSYLAYLFLRTGIQMNVMLFIFNVFFPMYPMDGAKLIVCSLQLYCGASARTAAKVLVFTSGPLAVFFIVYAFYGNKGGSGGMMQGVGAYMGFMCLMETYKIYQLLKAERLYMHPLFESARSESISMNDSAGVSQRLNDSEHDDPVSSLAPQARNVQFTQMQAFSGAGQTLSAGDPTVSTPSAQPQPSRAAWLEKMDRVTQDSKKTVRELEEERIEREHLGAQP